MHNQIFEIQLVYSIILTLTTMVRPRLSSPKNIYFCICNYWSVEIQKGGHAPRRADSFPTLICIFYAYTFSVMLSSVGPAVALMKTFKVVYTIYCFSDTLFNTS